MCGLPPRAPRAHVAEHPKPRERTDRERGAPTRASEGEGQETKAYLKNKWRVSVLC